MSYTNGKNIEFILDLANADRDRFKYHHLLRFTETGEVDHTGPTPYPADLDSELAIQLRTTCKWIVKHQRVGRKKLKAWKLLNSNLRAVIDEPFLMFEDETYRFAKKFI